MPRRVSLFGGAGVPLGVMAVFGALLVVMVLPMALRLLVFGLSGGGDHEHGEAATTTTTAAARVDSPVLGPVVGIHPDHPGAAVGGLRPDTVLQVQANGFDPFSEAWVRQCGPDQCVNEVKVVFGADGSASFQYLLVEVDGCRVTSPPCSVAVFDDDEGAEPLASLRMLFYDEVPPPAQVAVTPSSGLKPGDRIRVTVTGLPPGKPAQACAGGECGMVWGPAGVADIVVPPCSRGDVCSVVVTSPYAFVRAAPMPLSYAAPPTADYDKTRLGSGLALAALFLGAAAFLIRRGDWGPVGEEAAPEIDEAEYADLDAIVAALPPEPTLDELVAASR